jgi:hypothetical protein
MKTILSFRRRHYMNRFGLFLLTVYLIAAMVGCTAAAPLQYDLSVSSNAGGSVTTPGEGTFDYEEETVVILVASPDAGYQFVNWSGDVNAIASVNASSTTITMNADYSITANFEVGPPVQHSLTISSTAGGLVSSPGQGTFTYDEGKEIQLTAQPQNGYRFVKWIGDVITIADINSPITTVVMNATYSITARFAVEVEPMVAAGAAHTVGLKADGRVVAVGRNDYGQCNVGTWTDIIQVAGGGDHTVGLKSDGTVVAVGRNDYGQCDVSSWTGIVQVAGGGLHTVGLKADGRVVAVGDNLQRQCNVDSWTGIVQVAAGWGHTLGLKSDETVIAAGRSAEGQCDVRSWADIIQVAAGTYHTVGLKSNGNAVAVGWNPSGALNVGGWNVVQVAAGIEHSVGLESNGNVLRCTGWDSPGQCDFYDWTDIVQIAAGYLHTVGLKSDGTVVAVGQHDEGQCDVGGWVLS